MYNTRARSELLDSLDYLIPPVKKVPRTVHRDFLYNDVKLTDQSLLRDRHRTVIANSLFFKTSESDIQTCSSLILKKTTKQLIHERYSILNLSTCNRRPDVYFQNKAKQRNLYSKEEKPIIKVTVIPKAKETQTSKVFNKCCRYPNKVQSTVSDQDNSIKNQNVYLLIKGRKREKINELKISESAKLSDRNKYHKYGDVSIEQITQSRQLIKSLNMDKRKRKDNKKKKTNRTHISDNSPKNTYGEKFSSANDHRSRVTVVGQLGLTQDDRYVLKCAAAVNNEPVETNFINDDEIPMRLIKNCNFHQSSSQYRPTECNVNNCETLRQFRKQDSDVQTDIANPYHLYSTAQNNRAASQSTQVNFNFPNHPSLKMFKNQTAQCNCKHAATATPVDTDTDEKVLKKCKSPLVVISVYPRQEKETDRNDTVKIIQRQSSPERKEVTNITRSHVMQEKFKQTNPGKLFTTKKMEEKISRSRSPSPTTKNKKYVENKSDTSGRNNNSVMKCGVSQSKSRKSYILNNFQEHASCHCNDSTVLKTEDLNRQQNKTITNKSKDTEEVKKALVNSFLRKVNVLDKDNRKSKLPQPKTDASKVTINIDSENDHYDLLLEHSAYDTGFSVKKTTKARPPENFSSEEEVDTKSLENFLFVSNERMKKNGLNQETERTQPSDVLNIKPTVSRLNIKDSIEISRRQGEHSNYRLKPHLKNDKNDPGDDIFNSDLYAPVKHYRGDNCSLSDPNERDREIRELLGIMRCCRQNKTEHREGQLTREVGCCCRKKCSRGLMTGLSISKFISGKCLKRKCRKANMQNETIQQGPCDGKKKSLDKTDASCKDHQKLNISKMTTISVKVSEEETSESPETMTEDSKDIPQDIHGCAHDKIVSVKKKAISKESSKKEPSKQDHFPTVNMNDNIVSQNLILNRNIQIFLQVEQFNKERPVFLTRKQYDKVKRIIECTVSKKMSIEKRKRCSLKNCNVVSIGEIKVKPKLQQPLRLDREIQTDQSEIKKPADYITNKYKVKNEIKNILNAASDNHMATDVMATNTHNIEQIYPRQALSSMGICYASVEYKKHIIISSSSTRFKTDIAHKVETDNIERNSNSIHTIFKGHKRSATPNLGTSAYSLYSNVTDFSNKSYKQPPCAGDFKPKKPFLQRLISCLVMRSTQTSNVKETVQKRKLPSVNSSLDSYHISTSLGALEMTSSLYDTSASFYSNHTTMPVNKIKRGFFSSVRGFLTSRRS